MWEGNHTEWCVGKYGSPLHPVGMVGSFTSLVGSDSTKAAKLVAPSPDVLVSCGAQAEGA